MRKKSEAIAHIIVSLLDQTVVSATTFLTMVIISRHCSKAEVGLFALTVTIVNLTRTVQERAIAAPYLAFAYRPGFDRLSFKGSSFVHQAVLAIVATTLVGIATVGGLCLGVSRPWMIVIGSLVICLPFTLFRDQIRAISSASFQFKEQLVFDVVVGVTQLAGILLLGYLNRFSIAWVNIAIGFACCVPSAIWMFRNRNSWTIDRSEVLTDWKNNWRYSRWLVGARVFGVFGYLLVPWLVWYFMNETATGAFAICSSLVGISMMCITGLNNYFQPRTIRELHHHGIFGMIYAVVESIAIATGILTCVSIGFYFYGDYLLQRIFGSGYGEYGFIGFLLSLSTLSVSLSIMFGNGLAALGNSKQYFLGEFACCIVSVSAALVLIPAFGLVGACIALVLGGLSASIVTGVTLLRGIAKHKPSEPSDQNVELQSDPLLVAN